MIEYICYSYDRSNKDNGYRCYVKKLVNVER
nr:MAG TPA: hypothetical protein [Caudoviricetes sp.]